MALNKSSNCDYSQNLDLCFKGLYEYQSDEELANVHVFQDYPTTLLMFTAACMFIFTILSIPGNFVTIVALTKYKKVRNATAILIVNLSVSDLLITCLTFPKAILLYLHQSWTAGRCMCGLYAIFKYTLTATSLFTIVAITINRYVMMAHPSLYPKMYRRRNLIGMIIAIWVSAFSFVVPTIFEVWGRFSFNPRNGYCDIIKDKNGNNPKTTFIVIGLVIPSILIVICYTRIMYIVRKSTKKIMPKPPRISIIQIDSTSRNQEVSARELTSAENSEENYSSVVDREVISGGAFAKIKNNIKATFRRRPRRVFVVPTRRDKRLQSMIAALMVSFFAVHLPLLLIKIASNIFTVGPYEKAIVTILFSATVCSNPIIYVVMSKEYRKAYKKVFGTGRRH